MACTESAKEHDVKKSTFRNFMRQTYDELEELNGEEARLNPIVFNACNASFPFPFSQAFIFYNPSDDEQKTGLSFDLDLWYKSIYIELMDVLVDETRIREEDHKKYECLFDFITDARLKCLKILLEGNISEVKIANTLALHYFKPLVPNGSCVLDDQGKENRTCSECKHEIPYGDTSIGNSKVWHGRADILLKRSAVKVSLEENIGHLKLEKEDEHNEFDVFNDITDQLSIVEVETMKHCDKSSKAQVFSQAVVNAFYISKIESDRNQFIPSFLVTEGYIRVVLYNVEKDILLASSQMSIWVGDEEKRLNGLTLIRVWFALNFSEQLLQNDHILKRTAKSMFKEIVSEDAYQIYYNQLEQPMKSEKIRKRLKDKDAESITNEIMNTAERVARYRAFDKMIKKTIVISS